MAPDKNSVDTHALSVPAPRWPARNARGNRRSYDQRAAGSESASWPFDAVLLVLLDEELNAFAIYEAARSAVLAALAVPGSKG